MIYIFILILFLFAILIEIFFNKFNYLLKNISFLFSKKTININFIENNSNYKDFFLYNYIYITKYRIVQGYYTHTKKTKFIIEFKKFFHWHKFTKEIYTEEKANAILNLIKETIINFYSTKHAYTKNKKILNTINTKKLL